MKKRIAITILLILLSLNLTSSYAAELYKVKLGAPRAMRNAITSADVAIPPDMGSGFDMADFQYAIVDLTFSGIITNCTITPLFAASGATVYASGQSVTATTNSRYIVEVNGSSDFYIAINTLTGTNPNASIIVQGATE